MAWLRHISWFTALAFVSLPLFFGAFDLAHHNAAAVTDSRMPGSWFMLLNFDFNTFHPWKQDPAAAILPGEHWWRLYVVLLGAVFSLGFAASQRFSGSESLVCWSGAVLCWMVLLWLFGCDQVVLAFISVFPALEAAVLWSTRPKSILGSCAAAFTAGLLYCLFAQQLAPLGIFVCCVGSLFVLEAKSRDSVIQRIFWIALLPAAAYSVAAPAPIFPDYPLQARVVPDDGLSGMLRPLLGADSSIPISNWIAERYAVCGLTAVIAALMLSTFFLANGTPAKLVRKFKYLPIVLLLFVLGDAWTPTWLASIMPVQTFSRLVPGGVFYIPLVSIGLALGVYYAFRVCAMNSKSWPVWTIALSMMIVGAASSLVLKEGPIEALRFGQIYNADRGEVFEQLLMRAKTGEQQAARQYEEDFQKVISPSYAVYRLRGLSLLDNVERYQRRDYRALDNVEVISASSNLEKISSLTDGQESTRWFAGGGHQSGNEWLYVKFKTPTEIEGVEMSTGQYVTDYPRGIAVYGGSACGSSVEETLERSSTAVALFNEDDWQGPVLFTKSGLPYFGTQNYVRPVFGSSVKTNCLLIKQTRQDDHYDWSVAEMRLLYSYAEPESEG